VRVLFGIWLTSEICGGTLEKFYGAGQKFYGAPEKLYGAGQKFYGAADFKSATSILQFYNSSILQFFQVRLKCGCQCYHRPTIVY
jgi:hypothetical protein